MYYHLTYYRDWLREDVPLRDMEIAIGLYDNSDTPKRIAGIQNELCGPTERFRVYSSEGKKLTKKSILLFQGTAADLIRTDETASRSLTHLTYLIY